MTDATDRAREALEGITPGDWEFIVGHSDWGLPRSNVIVPAGVEEFDFDSIIAEVHSVTPYCIGSSRKEKNHSKTADANARFIAAAPQLVRDLLAENEALRAEARAARLVAMQFIEDMHRQAWARESEAGNHDHTQRRRGVDEHIAALNAVITEAVDALEKERGHD